MFKHVNDTKQESKEDNRFIYLRKKRNREKKKNPQRRQGDYALIMKQRKIKSKKP